MGYGHNQRIEVPRSRHGHLKDAFARFHQGVTFTASQQRFLDLFFGGSNICLTGAAGTGKSFVIKALLDFLDHAQVSVGRTATTGVAAFLIGGQTIHSFAGLGLADDDVETIIEKVRKIAKVKARLRAMKVLFLDEVSMAKGDLLDKLDLVLKAIRLDRQPWGGTQVVATGDFLQLLPVFKGDAFQELAFQCRAWREASVQTVVLREPVRHQGDNVLLQVLNDVRVGDTSSLHLLKPRVGATFPASDREPVRVFCHNVDVTRFNDERLSQLPGEVKTFMARDNGLPYHTESFNKNCPAPQKLDLKVGAQVMLLANLDVEVGFVNGSVGVVKAFGPMGVTVKFECGTIIVDRHDWDMKEQVADRLGILRSQVVATRSQIPLKVCYAVTVHRAQGATLDRAIIDIQAAFAAGQCYVALSRVRDLESLSIVGEIPHGAIRVHPECVRFYEDAEAIS